MDPGDFEIYHRRHAITRDEGGSMSKHTAKVFHLVREIVSAEPIRAIQHKLFGDYSRGSDQVVRRRHECSVGTSAGGNVVFAPVS